MSYVLNNGPRPVAAATRERVQSAMQELGYRPNLVARALRSSRSNTLGLVVPDSTEPFFTELVRAVERAAFAEGCLVLLGNSAFSRTLEQRYVESLSGMQVDGLLLVQAEVNEPRALPVATVPLVYLNHRAPQAVRAASVVLANRRGGALATDHLLQHGYARVDCLTGTARSGPVADRARGWADALERAGMAPGQVLRTGLDRQSTRDQVRRWLAGPDRPRAVMATADGLAMDVLTVAQELGVVVPDELAVFGFGATGSAAFSWPGLSTAGHAFDDIAREAVQALRRARETTTPPREVVLDVGLVLRRSCGCADTAGPAPDAVRQAAR